MSKPSPTYDIGFLHGNSAAGTNGYKPGNRNHPDTLAEYNRGFQDGSLYHHRTTRLQREIDAWRNLPKSTRGERPA